MILKGEKLEEYRVTSLYWLKRLVGPDDNLIQWDAITFQHGYSKKAERFTIECKKVSIRTGKHEWGALPCVKYFVFELGTINPTQVEPVCNYCQGSGYDPYPNHDTTMRPCPECS